MLARLSERQMMLLVLLFGALLYIPFAGSYGLWDPWETHYGEVARQMTSRGDYISLWWPGSPLDADFFWSKPVLTFWLMSIAMKVAGIGGAHAPAGEMAVSSTAEWALRVPFCLMALTALSGVYLMTSRFVSRRAGVIATVALATFPMFSLVARQAMTDMAFVGPMTLALALGALALFEEDDTELPRRSRVVGRWTLSWPHHPLFYVTVGLITLTAVPQLVINALQLSWRIHPKVPFALPGVAVMAPYIAGFVAFLTYSMRTRYRAPFYLYIAAILCGLAILAKGLAGLGLPVIVFLAYLLFTWNWKRLQRAQLLHGVLVALLACALVAIPWHNAMLIRHGTAFWAELYGDNHWRRLVFGRHGDRGNFEYFLRQLGYAVFPWVAIAPSALIWAAMRHVKEGLDRKKEIFWFGAIWFVSAYAIVSLSMTKFHHYILPALPGLAIVVGCFLDDLITNARCRVAKVMALIGIPLLALVTFDITIDTKSAQHFIWLFAYDYVNAPEGRTWPVDLRYGKAFIAFAGLFGAGVLLLVWKRAQRAVVAAMGVVAIVFTFFLLDRFMKQVSDRWSQKPLVAAYYKMRKSPQEKLIAWQMYWRGENFYTQNEIYTGPPEERTVFLGDRNAENLKEYLARNRGRRHFFLVEKTRWGTLQSLMPADAKNALKIVDDRNNKFYLAAAEL